MPLTTAAEVKEVGALTPTLFDLADASALDLYVNKAIVRADAWMQGHLGAFYNLTTYQWQIDLQKEGQIYLSLQRLTETLKAQKTYGTHASYISEEMASYERLIETDWAERAKAALDLWTTVENLGSSFAKPVFLVTDPVPIIEDDTNGLDPLNLLLEEQLARARGMSNPELGTVFR